MEKPEQLRKDPLPFAVSPMVFAWNLLTTHEPNFGRARHSVRAVVALPLAEKNDGAHRNARSVLDCGGAPPFSRRIAENRISPNARRNFNRFVGISVFLWKLLTTHEPNFGRARHSVRAVVALPSEKKMMALIETRAAFWTAAVLRRFLDRSPKIEFDQTPANFNRFMAGVRDGHSPFFPAFAL